MPYEHDEVAAALAFADETSWHGAPTDQRDRYRHLAEVAVEAAYTEEGLHEDCYDADDLHEAREEEFTKVCDRVLEGLDKMRAAAPEHEWDADTIAAVRERVEALKDEA
jgi:hypothetical protein